DHFSEDRVLAVEMRSSADGCIGLKCFGCKIALDGDAQLFLDNRTKVVQVLHKSGFILPLYKRIDGIAVALVLRVSKEALQSRIEFLRIQFQLFLVLYGALHNIELASAGGAFGI